MQGLAIRVARRLNACAGRTGKLFAERYHSRILRSPTEVRRVLVYVLNDARRHAPADVTFPRNWVDPMSSAPYFDGWRWRGRFFTEQPGAGEPTARAETWLLSKGWKQLGLIAPDEVPGEPR